MCSGSSATLVCRIAMAACCLRSTILLFRSKSDCKLWGNFRPHSCACTISHLCPYMCRNNIYMSTVSIDPHLCAWLTFSLSLVKSVQKQVHQKRWPNGAHKTLYTQDSAVGFRRMPLHIPTLGCAGASSLQAMGQGHCQHLLDLDLTVSSLLLCAGASSL